MRRIGLALTLCLFPLAACQGDKGGERVASAAGAATLVTVPAGANGGAAAATQAYTVVSGDSLWAISQHHCTTVAALVAANAWADGEGHPLYPGDVVMVPTGLCTGGNTGSDNAAADPATTPAPRPSAAPDTTSAPATTLAVATAGEVQAWLKAHDGFVPDPMYGDPADYYEDFGPICMEAWGRTYEFEKLGLGRDDVLAALTPLPGRTPAAVLASIDRWAAFTDHWYLKYHALIDEYTDNSGDADYDALVNDPDYLAFLAHYVPVAADQEAAHKYATTVCADLLRTKGSTP
jgi:LysM repeat protein